MFSIHQWRASLGASLTLACITLSLSSALQAQEAAPDSAAESSNVTYPASYFTQFNPNNVNDMLDRIPGIALALDSGDSGNSRGLGEEDQILVNGQRIPGKANEARNQLSRITAGQVEHIEIIRGSSGDLGARSAGLMVNIVLQDDFSRSSISTELSGVYYNDNVFRPGGSLSLNGQRGQLGYQFSVEAAPQYEQRDSYETSYLGDLSTAGNIYRNERTKRTDYRISSNLSYNPTVADRLQLNAQFEQRDPPMNIDRVITDLRSGTPQTSYEHERTDADVDAWELGGTWEHTFSGGDRYRLLFIVNDDQATTTRERFRQQQPGTEGEQNLFLFTDARNRERIVRTSYTWRYADNQDLEFGVEGAQTILDSKLALAAAIPGGTPAPEMGGLVPVPVPNANSSVEEMRYETFAVHNWQINPRMSLESGVIIEFSEIEQSGDTRNKRDFRFTRPRMDYRFDITRTLQLRARVEKNVEQLSFAQFVAAADTSDEQRDALAGNPNLVQEQSWRYEMNVEYRLPNDNGVLNARVFYHDIEDTIERVDITPSGGPLLSAPGNIGDAWKYGMALDASTRLSYLNLPGAIVTAGLRIEDSEVTDAFTGVKRRLDRHGRGSANLGFRHDITSQQLTYGFNVSGGFKGNRKAYDIQQIENYHADPNMTVFLQKVAFDGITFRLEARNALDNGRCRIRTRYPGRIGDSIPSLIENSCSNAGVSWMAMARTTF